MTTFDLAFLECAVNADGRSLNAIGKAANLPKGTLSRILNRKIERPDLDHLRGLAEALGHSLAELLGEAPAVPAGAGGGATLPHGAIAPNPDNPRRVFDKARLEELAQSIAGAGLIVPLTVTADGMLVDGERRWLAIGELIKRGAWAADRAIPVHIGQLGTAGARLAAGLVANLQREDLAPMEEARAMAQLIEDFEWSTADIAAATGCGQRHVQLRLNLVDKLSVSVQAALEAGEIPLAHARALTAAPAERQETALPHIIRGAYGWEDTAQIKQSLFRDMVPLGRNIFKLDAWPGEIVEDPDDPDLRYFQDKALFLEIQREAAVAKAAMLAAEGYKWVTICDRTEFDDWEYYDYDQDEKRNPAWCGAVIEIQSDLGVVIHRGLFMAHGEAEALAAPAAPEPGPYTKAKAAAVAAEAAATQPVRVTPAHMIACRQAKTETLQRALAARPDMALRAAVLGIITNGGMVRLRLDDLANHDQPPGAGPEMASPWAGDFKGLGSGYGKGWVDPWDEKKQAKAWAILCAMQDGDVATLHTALIAGLCGSWSGQAPGLGDGAVALAMAETLGLAHAQGLAIDAEFLATCGKPQLLEIARASDAGHSLKNIKVKDLVDLILADVKGGALADYIPPTAKFGTPAEIEAALPRKGE